MPFDSTRTICIIVRRNYDRIIHSRLLKYLAELIINEVFPDIMERVLLYFITLAVDKSHKVYVTSFTEGLHCCQREIERQIECVCVCACVCERNIIIYRLGSRLKKTH